MIWLSPSIFFSEGRDNEKNKQRLANIMAFGKDIDPHEQRKNQPPVEYVEEPLPDRFDESMKITY